MEKYLIVKGCAGLGNRLYTLSAAIEYAQQTNRTILVDWRDGTYAEKGINAFDLFFELSDVPAKSKIENFTNTSSLSFYPARIKPVIHNSIYYKYATYHNELLSFLPKHYIPKGSLRKFLSGWESNNNNSKSKLRFFIAPLKRNNFPFGGDLSYRIKENVVVFADYCPAFKTETLKKHISLKKQIQDKVEYLSNELVLNEAVGIHIRNTDMKPTIKIEEFRKKLISLNYGKAKIFLDTDNPVVLKQFRTEFPNLITLEKTFIPKNPNTGIHKIKSISDKTQLFENSILDMWLLSKCKILFYQRFSTFSTLSKFLSDSPYVYNWQDIDKIPPYFE